MKHLYASYFIRIKPKIKGNVSACIHFCVTTMLKYDISKSVQSYVINFSKEANKSSKNRNVNWDVYIYQLNTVN